jgi:hypothetical protein
MLGKNIPPAKAGKKAWKGAATTLLCALMIASVAVPTAGFGQQEDVVIIDEPIRLGSSVVLEADKIIIRSGAGIITGPGLTGTSASAYTAFAESGTPGSDILLITKEFIMEEGAFLLAGHGGHGGHARGVLQAHGGDGGAGGNIHIQAESNEIKGILLPGRGGDGGRAVTSGVIEQADRVRETLGGHGGNGGAVYVNGESVEFIPEGIPVLPASQPMPGPQVPLLAAGSRCDTNEANGAGLPIFPGLPGLPPRQGDGGDGGDACTDVGEANDGQNGSNGNGWGSCTDGQPGMNGVSADVGTVRGGHGGAAVTRGGNGGNGGDADGWGDAGDGGDGGRGAHSCDGGDGGDGGHTSGVIQGGDGGAATCGAGGDGGHGNRHMGVGAGGKGGKGGRNGNHGDHGSEGNNLVSRSDGGNGQASSDVTCDILPKLGDISLRQ